mmetsp:Transcript_27372/g.59479  ORF Transcript_27372/g.59479 Transcript_27372/m.59479 type:complete len:134 (-) Transcript_27372:124-525(-)
MHQRSGRPSLFRQCKVIPLGSHHRTWRKARPIARHFLKRGDHRTCKTKKHHQIGSTSSNRSRSSNHSNNHSNNHSSNHNRYCNQCNRNHNDNHNHKRRPIPTPTLSHSHSHSNIPTSKNSSTISYITPQEDNK